MKKTNNMLVLIFVLCLFASCTTLFAQETTTSAAGDDNARLTDVSSFRSKHDSKGKMQTIDIFTFTITIISIFTSVLLFIVLFGDRVLIMVREKQEKEKP